MWGYTVIFPLFYIVQYLLQLNNGDIGALVRGWWPLDSIRLVLASLCIKLKFCFLRFILGHQKN